MTIGWIPIENDKVHDWGGYPMQCKWNKLPVGQLYVLSTTFTQTTQIYQPRAGNLNYGSSVGFLTNPWEPFSYAPSLE